MIDDFKGCDLFVFNFLNISIYVDIIGEQVA